MDKPKYQYKYSVDSDGEGFEDATLFRSTWDKDCLDYVAEDAAEYDYKNCDGWEREWPITFKIWSLDGVELGVFEVEMDMTPTFVACMAEKAPTKTEE